MFGLLSLTQFDLEHIRTEGSTVKYFFYECKRRGKIT